MSDEQLEENLLHSAISMFAPEASVISDPAQSAPRLIDHPVNSPPPESQRGEESRRWAGSMECAAVLCRAPGFFGGAGCQSWRKLLALIAVYTVATLVPPGGLADPPRLAAQTAGLGLVTGARFRDALQQPLSGSWEQVDLRTICGRVQAAGHVSLLLDRRIDPSTPVDFQARDTPVWELTRALVSDKGARVVPVGNTLYLGPSSVAGQLRTLVALRQEELLALIHRGAAKRLLKEADLAWDDLARPAELVKRIARSVDLEVEQCERIPHDLWAAAQLPAVTPVESLSLILIQFDLTFEWRGDGRCIEVVEVPAKTLIWRPHLAPRGVQISRWLEEMQARHPERSTRVDGQRVWVEATVEEHEAIKTVENDTSAGLEPARPPHGSRSPVKDGGSGVEAGTAPAGRKEVSQRNTGLRNSAGTGHLGVDDRRRYTLRLQEKPLLSLLKTLERSEHGGWEFEYQVDDLAAAGVGLDRRITLEVREVKLEELLDKALKPAGLTYRRDGRRIVIEAER